MTVFNAVGLVIMLYAFAVELYTHPVRRPVAIGITLVGPATRSVRPCSGASICRLPQGLRGAIPEISFFEIMFHDRHDRVLFAGSMYVELGGIVRDRCAIAVLATLEVVPSTELIDGADYLLAVLPLSSPQVGKGDKV